MTATVTTVMTGYEEEMDTSEIIEEIRWHENRIVNSGAYEILFGESSRADKELYVWIWYDPENKKYEEETTEHVMTIHGLRTNSLVKILKEFDYTLEDLREKKA